MAMKNGVRDVSAELMTRDPNQEVEVFGVHDIVITDKRPIIITLVSLEFRVSGVTEVLVEVTSGFVVVYSEIWVSLCMCSTVINPPNLTDQLHVLKRPSYRHIVICISLHYICRCGKIYRCWIHIRNITS